MREGVHEKRRKEREREGNGGEGRTQQGTTEHWNTTLLKNICHPNTPGDKPENLGASFLATSFHHLLYKASKESLTVHSTHVQLFNLLLPHSLNTRGVVPSDTTCDITYHAKIHTPLEFPKETSLKA